MNEPLFLSKEQVLSYHSQQILLFGGDPGLGDASLLESALAQPQHVFAYVPSADLFDLAATYAFHMSKNHPFVDGNKRVALQCCLGFLFLNGVELTADGADLYELMIRLVTNEIDKQVFAAFLRSNSNVV